MPGAYLNNMNDRSAPKLRLGVIGRTERFKRYKATSPGPGEYDTQVFKSLSRGELSIMGGANPSSPK